MAKVVNVPRKYSYKKESSQPYKSMSSVNSMNDRYSKKRMSTTEYNCYEEEDYQNTTEEENYLSF